VVVFCNSRVQFTRDLLATADQEKQLLEGRLNHTQHWYVYTVVEYEPLITLLLHSGASTTLTKMLNICCRKMCFKNP